MTKDTDWGEVEWELEEKSRVGSEGGRDREKVGVREGGTERRWE